MSDFGAFLALAYENLAGSDDPDDLDGLDEVMYQTGLMLALARAGAEASERPRGDDGADASGPGTIAIARGSPWVGARGDAEEREPSTGVPSPHPTAVSSNRLLVTPTSAAASGGSSVQAARSRPGTNAPSGGMRGRHMRSGARGAVPTARRS